MKKIFLQAVHFWGLSGVGWILDFIVYMALGRVSADLVINNFISSGVGVTFVFLTATIKVFKNNSKIPLKLKYIIYLGYQCGLIFFISKLLNIMNLFILTHVDWAMITMYANIWSKIFVTPITMVLNFCVMKYIIEKL